MSYAIETVNLTKRFPKPKRYRDLLNPFRREEITALEDVSIQVNKGEIFGLLGPNGAGKTTLIKILCTLVLPTAGKAYVNGYDVIKHEREVKRTIGYVMSEERSFYWRLTGRQNIRFFATLNNLSTSETKKRIEEVLEFLGLQDDADKTFKEYSTGMKQKLAIARALLTNPEILFMDEPTKSLDPSAAQHLRDFIKERIVAEQNTIFFATHNLQEAEELCDRIAIMNRGRIKACGALKEIREILSKEQRYTLKVRNLSDDMFDKLKNFIGVSKVVFLPNNFVSNNVTLEIEVDNQKGNISEVIERIVLTGGQIIECSPKEVSFNEVFAKITEGDN